MKAKPKLYKRGNEDINLDVFNNIVIDEIQQKLADSGLNQKLQDLIYASALRILAGMNDGTFRYNPTGGFYNTVGMNNSNKNDLYAAGLIGNILRSQTAYVEPEEPKETETKRYSNLEDAINYYLYGDNKPNLEDWINIDYNPETKKVEGNTKRIERYRQALLKTRDNIDTLFSDWEEKKRIESKANLDSALELFSNGLTPDKYFELSKLTGMSGFDELFAIPTYGTKPSTDSQTATQDTAVTLDELTWLSLKHPRTTTTNLLNRPLTYSKLFYAADRKKLSDILYSTSLQNLLKMVKVGLSGKDANLNTAPNIVDGFGGLTQFENDYILLLALDTMVKKLYIKPISENSNIYYIPFNEPVLDKSNTAIVYKVNPDGTRAIIEMDRNDIPYFLNLWHLEYISSHKQGGVINKFLAGGLFSDVVLTALKNWSKTTPNQDWNIEGVYHGNAGDLSDVEKLNRNYTSDFKAVGEDLQNYINSTDFSDLALTPEEIVELYNQNALKIRNFWNLEAIYNVTPAGEHNRLFRLMFGNRSKITGGNKDYNLSYDELLENKTGSQTWLRRMDRYEKEFDLLTPEERKNRIFKITRTIGGKLYMFDVYKKANGDIALYHPDLYENTIDPIKEDIQTKIKTDPTLGETEKTPIYQTSEDEVSEKIIPRTEKKYNRLESFLEGLAPDILNAGRLWHSLLTNNRNYRTLYRSLKSVMYDPTNLYRPLIGRLDIWQAGKEQIALNTRMANSMADADADRNTARMFEMTKINNDANLKNDLQYNESVLQSAEKLFDLNKQVAFWNKERVYMPNVDAINRTNREIAELKASKIKNDFTAKDNYMADIISRLRIKNEEHQAKVDQFEDDYASETARKAYERYYKQAYAAALNWLAANPGASITDWPLWSLYLEKISEAADRSSDMLSSYFRNKYRLPYTSNYTDQGNKLFFTRGLRWS